MGANGSLCRSLGRPRTADGVPVNNMVYSRANQEIFRPSFAIPSIVKIVGKDETECLRAIASKQDTVLTWAEDAGTEHRLQKRLCC